MGMSKGIRSWDCLEYMHSRKSKLPKWGIFPNDKYQVIEYIQRGVPPLIVPDFCRSAIFHEKKFLSSKVCDGSDVTVQLQSMNPIGPEGEGTVSFSEEYFAVARIVFSKFRFDVGEVASQDQVLNPILVDIQYMDCKDPRFLAFPREWFPSEVASTLVE
jgi:hypothetical protein